MDFNDIIERLKGHNVETTEDVVKPAHDLLLSRIKNVCNIKEVPEDKEIYVQELLFYNLWIDGNQVATLNAEGSFEITDITLGDTKVSTGSKLTKEQQFESYMVNRYNSLWKEFVITTRRIRW